MLAQTTSYPDDALAYRVPSSEDGPRANYATFVAWTLMRNGSPFPNCFQENLTSSTADPVPSPPSPLGAEQSPEPTNDGEPEPATTEPRIAAEPELYLLSDQPLCSTLAHHLYAASSILCHPPSSLWLENPSPPPRPIDPAAPPWLLGSALVWHRPSCASGLHSSGFTSSLRPCCSGSITAFQIHATGSSSALLILLVTLPHRLSVSAWGSFTTCSPTVGPWSPQPFLLHGSFLHQFHHGPSSWLWPGSRLAPPAPSPSCCLPVSFLRCLHPGLLEIRPPTEPPPKFPSLPPFVVVDGTRTPFWEGAISQDYGLFLCCV
ncbi:Translation initiation factor IF-2 [Labeo rohita]|uniref:Translation initiation factor IF-2 n=1 Tax=Labeo rohita TaxID=84645 RepID=A0ABQ8MA06_LABRO|nr:Translation initiation factor IF-2 [Labeo rohita]